MRWWLAWRCRHGNVRCIHGDEIIFRGWKRVLCLDCGRALPGDLPLVCWYSGDVHWHLRGVA